MSLRKRQSISEMVQAYQRSIATIRDCFSRLADVEDEMNATFGQEGCSTFSLRTAYGSRPYSFRRDLDDILKQLRCDAWWQLFETLEVRRFLSVKRFKELQESVEKDKFPEITQESVSQAFASMTAAMPEMLREAVEEVFDFLRPRNSKYKTNTELEIGRKAVLESRLDTQWSKYSLFFSVRHYYAPQLSALENVFNALDGRGALTKHHRSDLENAIRATPINGGGRGETSFFKFRACKNGNLHLEFLRPDLLQRFNEIAGGRRLRPAKDAS